jgi:CheY-like chemotaxis protein
MANKKYNLIMVVDDDMIFRESARMWLNKEDLCEEIALFEDGELAIEWFKENSDQTPPDMVILDINMPIMDGWDFLQAFDELELEGKENVTIVMVSSSINPEDIERAHQNRWLKDYVNKPLTPQKMAELFLG